MVNKDEYIKAQHCSKITAQTKLGDDRSSVLLALSYDFTCVVCTCLLVYFVAAVSHVLCFYV